MRFILEVSRSLYAYAQRMRHLPPYASNPFSDLGLDRMQNVDAKPVFVFTAASEFAFLRAASDWAFPIHFLLAKTGLRPGELTHLLIEDLDLDGGWLVVRNKLELGWRVKTGSERTVPLASELCRILEFAVQGRSAGPVFVRPEFRKNASEVAAFDRKELARLVRERIGIAESEKGRGLSRQEQLHVSRIVWRDAGALKNDSVRRSFMRVTRAIGHREATCPKSWRHTFATLLQDANVDPLIRQLTLGHKPQDGRGALGMTGVYTHTRPETQRREVMRALQLWPDSLALAQSRLSDANASESSPD